MHEFWDWFARRALQLHLRRILFSSEIISCRTLLQGLNLQILENRCVFSTTTEKIENKELLKYCTSPRLRGAWCIIGESTQVRWALGSWLAGRGKMNHPIDDDSNSGPHENLSSVQKWKCNPLRLVCVRARAQKHYAQSQLWLVLAKKFLGFCDGDFLCVMGNLHEFISTARATFEQKLMLDHAYKPQKSAIVT